MANALSERGYGMNWLDNLFMGFHTHLATGIGAAIGAFLMYISAQTVKYIRGQKKMNSVEHQIARALKIQELLATSRVKWGADRVYVFQFSNGTYYANKVSQLNMTCTHQSVGPGVATIGDQKTEYLVSQYPEMFADFVTHKCVFKNIEEVDYPTMRSILEAQGVRTFLATSFSCPHNDRKIEGFVGIDYMHREKDGVPEGVCSELSGFAERIGQELRS